MGIQALQLDPSHQWKARPEHRILIVDGGAVRFDFPKDWNLYSGPKYVALFDASPLDYTCVLTVSAKRISISQAMIPFGLYVREITQPDEPGVHYGNVIRIFRPPLEAAWFEMRFFDPYGRAACKRVCFARAGCTRALITFDFRPHDELRMFRPWNTVMETLVVGDYVEDPVTGRKREKRG
jgi:hypothetical protein